MQTPSQRARPRPSARRFTVAVGVSVVVAMVVLLATTTGRGPHALACAGQCRPPYQLQVLFKPGTTANVAGREARRCRQRPEVDRVGPARKGVGGLEVVTFYTRDLGRGPKTGGLLSCLARQPQVAGTGWPG